MADTQIKAELDRLDRLTIILYRSGMLLTAISLFTLALQQLFYPLWFKQTLLLLALGALLQASSLHIYNKHIRWLLVSASWFGCWILSVSFATSGLLAAYLCLGAFIITLSGLAYKESHCFSLTILKTIPLLLVFSWLAVVFSLPQWAACGFIVSAILYGYMAWRKIKMPLHYDLGDRRKYEI